MLKKTMIIGVVAAGFGLGVSSASFAQSANGTVNSNIGSSGASTGVNGSLHSGANHTLNSGARLREHRSVGGVNSGIGSSGASTGTNGALHSGANGAMRTSK